MSRDAYICATVRTPIGRYGGALAKVRAVTAGGVARAIGAVDRERQR